MTFRILVAYASKYGATAEIAEKIGQVLREAGLTVHVLNVSQVFDLTPFDAVVLGSAVYDAGWRKEAVEFLEEYEASLAKIPVWLFSSGAIGKGNPTTLMHGWQFPADLQARAYRIHPRDVAYFNGALDMEKINFAERIIIKENQSPAGDFRDWEAITNWAAGISAALKPQTNQ